MTPAGTARVQLRTGRSADADAIARIHTESWQRTYRRMMTDDFLDRHALQNRLTVWHERLDAPSPGQYVCVAESGPTIVGFICAYADHDPVWGSYIDNLHVVYGMHRRGIGCTLMRSAAAWLSQVGAHREIYLWVMEANAPSRAFYERLGASNAGTIVKVDPGGGQAPNCRYVWARPSALLWA